LLIYLIIRNLLCIEYCLITKIIVIIFLFCYVININFLTKIKTLMKTIKMISLDFLNPVESNNGLEEETNEFAENLNVPTFDIPLCNNV